MIYNMDDSDYKKIVLLDTRAWLAGMALSGLCANTALSNTMAVKFNTERDMASKIYASMAREIADATLEELAKEKP